MNPDEWHYVEADTPQQNYAHSCGLFSLMVNV